MEEVTSQDYSTGLLVRYITELNTNRCSNPILFEWVPTPHPPVLPFLHTSHPQSGFPYRECRADSCLDGVLLQQLKESVCHMDATQYGVHDYQFSVMSKTPGNLLDYEIKLSDEALLAPMGVFFPSSFCLPDNTHLMAGI